MISSRQVTSCRFVFFFSFAAALIFAAYTNHVWEDYYITYRASKNLATGSGLVFNHGDRLHTFTSPLGVLLPALSSLLTLNRSDTVALWLFRVMSSAAFAGAATLFYSLLLQLGRPALLAGFASAWLCFDAKSLDFTINGMETGLLLLFVAWSIWAQFSPALSRRWLWLGCAWAGVMWTRPDGFLYIGLLAVGGWLFNDTQRTGLSRKDWLKLFFYAGVVCTALYLPWFVGSWIYYGTPIPHTITAKSAIAPVARTLLGALQMAVQLPYKLWTVDTSLRDSFLPAYHMMGGWPSFLRPLGSILGTIAAFGWLFPFFDRPTRAASLAFFGLHVYLNYFPYFPFPWYLPGTTFLGYFVLAGAASWLITSLDPNTAASPRRGFAQISIGLCGVLIAVNAWTTFAVARQFKSQQTWIESGNRQKIGEWLRTQADPGDRVFLEPLGYIGFFSGLKTYDFPGLSSREMVDAIRRVGGDWAQLIDFLGPEWLVLRPIEVERVTRGFPSLLTTTYHQVREFSVLDQVKALDIHGRAYLEFDACFRVFRRERPNRFITDEGEVRGRYPISSLTIDQRQMHLVHAPATWSIKVPAEARHVHLAFGFPPGAYGEDPKTDGATFTIKLVDASHEEVLTSRTLDPVREPKDRGVQNFEATLPTHSAGAKLELISSSGPTDTKDWTSWSRPEFW